MIHHFEPTHYYNTIGSHKPVLHVSDGDTIMTSTVDARGQDKTGETVTRPGNPQTGPFYVENAEPGDTLAVHLDKLTPNRPIGWTRPVVASHIMDAEYIRTVAQDIPDTEALCEWEMNVEDKTVTLINPTNTRLGRMTLPMSPMVGCFGVAPSLEQAISTATSSNHGGNMDYRGFVEGVTVYFPVFAPGALFHIGDGHALQGDGEIVGTGIEISFDVQFTVRVLKGKKGFWPRAENETYIFTAGNARPLDQCIQHATTEMLRWLQSDYDLDPRSAHTLLGQCVEYDMGNVYDPAYTMVCKIKKILLENIGINTHSVHNDFSKI